MLDVMLGNLGTVIKRLRLTLSLLMDRRVPIWTKVVPIAAVIYILSPIDIMPDVFLGLGQMDDLMILIAGLELFERIVPEPILQEHINQSSYDYSYIEERRIKDTAQ